MGINNHFCGQKRQQKFALQMYFMATMWHLDEHQHSVSILSSVYKIMSDIWANNSAPENPTFLKLGQVAYQYFTTAHSWHQAFDTFELRFQLHDSENHQ